MKKNPCVALLQLMLIMALASSLLVAQDNKTTPTQQTQEPISPQEYRKNLNARIMAVEGTVDPVKEIKNVQIPGPGGDLPLRIYQPDENGPFPLVVYLHGAGWVAGNLDTHDNVCRYLSHRVRAVVVSVGYRLAPEHKFPAAFDDAYAATVWAAKNASTLNADSTRLAVVGDSSGGNLAAAVVLKARDQKAPAIAFQLLINPALDVTAYDAKGFESMKWFREQYLSGKADFTNPYASPLLAADVSNLPAAFILTGEKDVLREEGEKYARRLQAAGVFVNHFNERGKGHLGPAYARAHASAQEALELSVTVLKAALSK